MTNKYLQNYIIWLTKWASMNYVIVLPQVLSTTRLVLITSCIDQNLLTIRFPVANYLRYTDVL